MSYNMLTAPGAAVAGSDVQQLFTSFPGAFDYNCFTSVTQLPTTALHTNAACIAPGKSSALSSRSVVGLAVGVPLAFLAVIVTVCVTVVVVRRRLNVAPPRRQAKVTEAAMSM
jgi:hypothetical protein